MSKHVVKFLGKNNKPLLSRRTITCFWDIGSYAKKENVLDKLEVVRIFPNIPKVENGREYFNEWVSEVVYPSHFFAKVINRPLEQFLKLPYVDYPIHSLTYFRAVATSQILKHPNESTHLWMDFMKETKSPRNWEIYYKWHQQWQKLNLTKKSYALCNAHNLLPIWTEIQATPILEISWQKEPKKSIYEYWTTSLGNWSFLNVGIHQLFGGVM